ncbi:hypothetical protein D3C75_282050 [compost metagenome]
MKTYEEITKILVDKRLPAPWFLLDELQERDKVIKELQEKAHRWEKAFDNADKQYLKKEKEAAELRRMIERRDERMTEKDATIKELQAEIKVVKKAIEAAGKVINQKGAQICELKEQLD